MPWWPRPARKPRTVCGAQPVASRRRGSARTVALMSARKVWNAIPLEAGRLEARALCSASMAWAKPDCAGISQATSTTWATSRRRSWRDAPGRVLEWSWAPTTRCWARCCRCRTRCRQAPWNHGRPSARSLRATSSTAFRGSSLPIARRSASMICSVAVLLPTAAGIVGPAPMLSHQRLPPQTAEHRMPGGNGQIGRWGTDAKWMQACFGVDGASWVELLELNPASRVLLTKPCRGSRLGHG